jgi:hypothetical protein
LHKRKNEKFEKICRLRRRGASPRKQRGQKRLPALGATEFSLFGTEVADSHAGKANDARVRTRPHAASIRQISKRKTPRSAELVNRPGYCEKTIRMSKTKVTHLQVGTTCRAAFQRFQIFQQSLSVIPAEFGKIAARPTERSDSSRAGQQNVPGIEIPRSIHMRQRELYTFMIFQFLPRRISSFWTEPEAWERSSLALPFLATSAQQHL